MRFIAQFFGVFVVLVCTLLLFVGGAFVWLAFDKDEGEIGYTLMATMVGWLLLLPTMTVGALAYIVADVLTELRAIRKQGESA